MSLMSCFRGCHSNMRQQKRLHPLLAFRCVIQLAGFILNVAGGKRKGGQRSIKTKGKVTLVIWHLLRTCYINSRLAVKIAACNSRKLTPQTGNSLFNRVFVFVSVVYCKYLLFVIFFCLLITRGNPIYAPSDFWSHLFIYKCIYLNSWIYNHSNFTVISKIYPPSTRHDYNLFSVTLQEKNNYVLFIPFR